MVDTILISICYIIISITLLSIIVLITKQFTKKEECPYCNNTIDLERIKKNQIVNYIPFSKVIRLLCYKCHRRHYRIIK